MNPLDPKSPAEFQSVARPGEDEFVIEKSRFIGCAAPVQNEEEARAFIAALKSAHPQATHVCSAWIIGAGGLAMRFSDDGEPSGTAGVPILEVLKKEGLTDIVCGVVRYFGGVKLGAGGLVRAYTQGAVTALEAAEITTWTRHRALVLSADYTFQGTISYQLEKTDWLLTDTTYDDRVHFHLFIPAEDEAAATERINSWTSGRAELDWGDFSYQGRKNV
ncbi:MAG: YigZ family protein [Peptococcaceae bacterium]|nr:YigZ family protein [Peptococcaceae bacterium]